MVFSFVFYWNYEVILKLKGHEIMRKWSENASLMISSYYSIFPAFGINLIFFIYCQKPILNMWKNTFIIENNLHAKDFSPWKNILCFLSLNLIIQWLQIYFIWIARSWASLYFLIFYGLVNLFWSSFFITSGVPQPHILNHHIILILIF